LLDAYDERVDCGRAVDALEARDAA
jgi:hypothetical protein